MKGFIGAFVIINCRVRKEEESNEPWNVNGEFIVLLLEFNSPFEVFLSPIIRVTSMECGVWLISCEYEFGQDWSHLEGEEKIRGTNKGIRRRNFSFSSFKLLCKCGELFD